MEMHLSRGPNQAFEPPVHALLQKLPPDALFHREHKLRHPSAIYFLSLEKLVTAFIRVAELYFSKRYEYRFYTGREEVTQAKKIVQFEFSDILSAQEAFLRALQEHLDDCYLILKTLIDPAFAKDTTPFADKYVLANLRGAKSFSQAVSNFKKSLIIANKLKHQQGRLQGVLVVPGSNIGYYLETPSIDGALGSSPDVHSNQSCFSFARDLAFRLASIYRCSESLSNAISRNIDCSRLIPNLPIRDRPSLNWDNVVELATRLPEVVFSNELSLGTASFRINGSSDHLIIKIPDRRITSIQKPYWLWLKLTRDGYSDKLLPPKP